MQKLVVTRYKSLVDYLKQLNLIDDNVKVLPHASPDDVRNKHVLGVLPYWLACHTAKFTEIQLRIPSEKRGTELRLEEIEFYALEPKTYIVRLTSFEDKKKEEKKEEKEEKKEEKKSE